MDANGTGFHLVLGPADWLGSGVDGVGVEWHKETMSVSLRTQQFIFPRRRTEHELTHAARRGAAGDRYGNWYWIDDDRRGIRFRGGAADGAEVFWPGSERRAGLTEPADFVACAPTEPEITELAGLTITNDHYLVVGVLQPAGLLIFDLSGGGAPSFLRWPAAVALTPTDLAAAPDGGVFVLDAVNARYWRLDRFFRLRIIDTPGPARVEHFTDVSGRRPCSGLPTPELRVTPDAAYPLTGGEPSSLEVLPDASLLVLERDAAARGAWLSRYRDGRLLQRMRLNDALRVPREVDELLSHGHDIAFVAARDLPGIAGVLYVAAPDGNQAFAFDLDQHEGVLHAGFQHAYLPMRRFGGRALVVTPEGAYYDENDRWLPLVRQPRPLFTESATLQLPAAALAFDGREPGCVWHRLFLDACIPPGSAVEVASRTADDLHELEQQSWQMEPRPYLRLRGPELPHYQPRVAGTPDRAGTWELLFQNCRGRYLQLQLTLRGTGRVTPRLQVARIYFPRFSYVEAYLPAAYRDDESAAHFLERYLANAEGTFTELEDRVAAAHAFIDTRTVSSNYLDWLASWLGASLDFSWSTYKRRLFLAHAIRVFAERGTRAGLERALRLALESCPDDSLFEGCAGQCTNQRSAGGFTVRVVERFLTRRAPGVVFGDVSDVPGAGSTTESLDWSPARGVEPLIERYRDYLTRRYADLAALNADWGVSVESFAAAAQMLPATQPANAAQAAAWRQFLREALGFTYAVVTSADLPFYQQFLARRYKNIADLNRAWGLSTATVFASFSAVPLPTVLPRFGAALQDWILFVSLVLPMQRNAHRFTVLVPVALQDTPQQQSEKLELARRITEIEKPAHTDFDVKAYWAAFRVGEARLGQDTVLGSGSRFAALVLGQGLLGAGYLGWVPPWDAQNRLVIGRDRLQQRLQHATS